MRNRISRRDFLHGATLISLGAAGGAGMLPFAAFGVDAPKPPAGGQLKVALNAYSFSKMINDSVKGRGAGITLLQLLDFCAKYKFEGLDPTGYFFPGYPKVPADAYVFDFKRKAADLGIGISGTGVRNNFTTSDKKARAESVQHIKEWVEVAAKLGAPVIRVFADTQMKSMTWHDVAKGFTRAQVQEWIAADLHECAQQGKKFGVRIGVQNHGDFLQTGEEHLALLKAANSEWCGPIVDTGYYKSPDPYADMALVAPQAVNWQIKQRPFGDESETPTDLIKLMTIVRKSGYSGYLPIETLSSKNKPYDPFTVVPEFLIQVRAAMQQTA